MLTRLKKVRNYTRGELRLLLSFFLRLLAAELFLRVTPPARIIASLNHVKTSPETGSAQKENLEKVIRLLAIADRQHGMPPSCLRKAVTLKNILTARGLSPNFEIGIHKEAGKLHAHAWLEIDGRRLEMNDNSVEFTPLRPASPAPL